MLGGLTIPGADRLLSPELAQLMDDVNFLKNRWTGHGGTISDGEAENRHIELKDKLSQLQALLGSGWGGLDLIRAGKLGPRPINRQSTAVPAHRKPTAESTRYSPP